MFSTTTTESSMIRPMATARPPSDMRLSVSPVRCRKTKVMIRLRGMETAVSSVARMLRRNSSRMSTLNAPPMRMASRTLAIEVRTRSPWS